MASAMEQFFQCFAHTMFDFLFRIVGAVRQPSPQK